MKSIENKLEELRNVTCVGIKDYEEQSTYSYFYEFELDNGEFILVNEYIYSGNKIKSGDVIDDGWCIYKESVIDKIKDDEFWENCYEYFSDDFKSMIYDEENLSVVVYNKYIDIIKECFDIENATDDFQE